MMLDNAKLNNYNLDQVIKAEATELSKLLQESNLRAKEQVLRNCEQIVALKKTNEGLNMKVEKQVGLVEKLGEVGK
jgi:hypothetical protein